MATWHGVFQSTLTLVALMTREADFPAVYTPASSRQGGPDTSLENRHYSSQLFLLGERYTSKVMICKAICENMVDVALTQIGVVLPGISLCHPGIMPIAGTEETWLPQSLSHAVAAKRRCSSGKSPRDTARPCRLSQC